MRSSCQAKRADVIVTELKESFVCFGPKQKCSLNLLYWWYNILSETESLQERGNIYSTLPIFRCLGSMSSRTVPPLISVWLVLQTTSARPAYNQANEICVEVGTEASQAGFFLKIKRAWMLIIHKTWEIQYNMCAFFHFQFRGVIRKAVHFSSLGLLKWYLKKDL